MKALCAFLGVVLILAAAPAAQAGPFEAVVGTGSELGLYHPTGLALAKVVNGAGQDMLRLKVVTSGGSVDNINGLLAGRYTLGLAQADRALQAYTGKAEWKKTGPQRSLRAVYGLFTETVMCVARQAAGIKRCADLRGKRVALGNPGSGTRQNALDALRTCGLRPRDLAQAVDAKPQAAAELLAQGKIDAMFFTVGNPDRLLRELSQKIKVALLPFDHAGGLLSLSPQYVPAHIMALDYPRVRCPSNIVKTFGVKALVCATLDTPEEVVYEFTRLTFGRLHELKSEARHMSLLSRAQMLKTPLPLHPGARRYYVEDGWLNPGLSSSPKPKLKGVRGFYGM